MGSAEALIVIGQLVVDLTKEGNMLYCGSVFYDFLLFHLAGGRTTHRGREH